MRRDAVLLSALLVLAPSAAGAGDRPVAEIEQPQALGRFFESLSRLERTRGGTVRVVQLGDSHTAADHQSAAARRALQARFGDAGRGTVLFGQAVPGEAVRLGTSGEWHSEQARRSAGERGDGRYGLGGWAVASSARGARAWLDGGAPSGRVELAYLKQPSGGSFEVLVGGERRAKLSAWSPSPRSAWETLELGRTPRAAVEIRLEGDGEVRLLGASLERPGPGLVYDALGINGARASVLLEWDEAHLVEQLSHRSPDLVVLAYGTNESGERGAGEAWERQLAAGLERIARAAPTAACLVLGPPDRAAPGQKGWASLPALPQVVAAQRRAAQAAGCAYFSQYDAMGGEGSMVAWAAESPPRAARDRVHLTREGYGQLGAAFAAALVSSYDRWSEAEMAKGSGGALADKGGKEAGRPEETRKVAREAAR